jgi:glycosyltransferase involved in cell wall biosynthesis
VKVLLLHQHFNMPQKGGAIRSYYLAKALVDNGASVIVITGHNERTYRLEIQEGIEVHYLPVQYYNRFGFYKRGFSFIKYVRGAMKLAAKYKDVDLVYAISAPLTVGIAAMQIKSRYNIPFIFEVGDLWPDAPIQLGFVRNKVLQKSLYLLEKRIYSKANAIVGLSEAIRKGIEVKVPDKKVHVVPNMADTVFFKPEKKNPEAERKFQVEGKFVVSYIGAIGFANGLDYFLECACASKQANLPVHFLICGEGGMLEKLKATASTLQLSNLTFVPFQNREGVKEILNITDANFICYRDVHILETGSPNKYFDGLAAGKLTLINFSGWIKEEIERENCGIYLNAKVPSEFVAKLLPFVYDRELLQRYQFSSRSLAERKYARLVLGDIFYRIVDRSF